MKLAALVLLAAAGWAVEPLELWYRQPALDWEEALPLGNGRMGAMVFGRTAQERIQFNEHTVWTGRPHDYAHPGAYRHLGRIRELLFQGKQAEAEKLALQEFMSVPIRQRVYQAFGDIRLEFPGIRENQVSDYRRSLDLDSAVAAVRFAHGGVTYRREVFASWPAQVIVVRLTADKPGSLSFLAGLKSAHDESSVSAASKDELSMSGAVADSAIRFEARLKVNASGGRQEARGDRIAVTGANSATLILTGATNFKSYLDVTGDPQQRNDAVLRGVRGKSYDGLRAAHVADHQRLFRRVALDLGRTPAATLPTDERIRAFAGGDDPQLVALLYQFGRYLLIGSSRPGGQPANLQGVWNDSNRPAWDSKYTVNINTEMNYWPAE
ncbi:MAG: glycoside hydrolase family 95 protein, partial [Acidobacteria bacterium]|nr:glycoside hydrolase family 95 protein [Acidobacteriota bacterium]